MSQIPALISDLAVILISAGLVTLLFKKLKQPVVLGYIVAGILSGPSIEQIPTVTDVESAKWVAGLQLKKCAYEQVSAITEKIKDMLDPTSGMTDAQKSSYDRKVMNKVYSGKKLSAEEMRYIKIHYPALYPYVERVQIQRQALEERIKHCHSKEEVQDVYSEAMFHISDDDPAKQMLYAAYDDVLKEFKKTSDYQELPETKEDAEKKKQTKKVSSAEPADETDDIQEDWKNAFLSESTGVSVGTTHTDSHLRPATNPAV